MAARQRFLDMMYARTEAEDAQRKAEEEQKLAADNKNWMDEGMQGAAIGASAGGPWGALFGGIAGTAAGMHKAHNQRKKEGQGTFEATWRTAFDTPFGTSNLNATNMGYGAQAFSNAKGSVDRKKAMESTAAANARENSLEEDRLRLERERLDLDRANSETYRSQYRDYRGY